MSPVQLKEVRFEFYGCTIYGTLHTQNQLKLRLCGHGMGTNDAKDVSSIVSWLKKQDTAAERLTACSECSACDLGCFTASCEEPPLNQLDQLMHAVVEAINVSGKSVELTFVYAEKLYSFFANWEYLRGGIGTPGYSHLNNTWTYFAENTTDQLLTAIRNIPGITKVSTEGIQGTSTKALDIQVSSSRHTSLEDCLTAVVTALAA